MFYCTDVITNHLTVIKWNILNFPHQENIDNICNVNCAYGLQPLCHDYGHGEQNLDKFQVSNSEKLF